jgi:hypothetical protein
MTCISAACSTGKTTAWPVTVGALTGHLAQPEAPRNMIRVWEEKLAFTLRYFAADAPEVARCEKLVRLLRQNIPTRI